MQRPILVGFALAENLKVAGLISLAAVNYHLHPAARLGVSVLRVIFRIDQGIVQLQFLDHRPGGILGQRHGGCHGPVQRAGHYYPPIDPVVIQPRRFRGVHFPLKHHIAPGRFVPSAQQRVAVIGNPSRRGRRPETPPLEGVAGDGDFAPPLAGEQALEMHRQTGFVGPGNGQQKGVGPFRFGTVKGRAQQAGPDQWRGRDAAALGPVQRHQRPQDGVGAKLYNRVHAQLGGQGFNALPEGHRRAGVLPPVGPVHLLSRTHRLAGYVADQRRGRFPNCNVVKDRRQVVQGRLH